MEMAKLKLNCYGFYSDYIIPSKTMRIIMWLLASDIRCPVDKIYEKWILDDNLGMNINGNVIALEKEGDYVYLTNMYEEAKKPTVLKISRHNLIQLLHDWNEKVCQKMPPEVIINYENDIFMIETSNE